MVWCQIPVWSLYTDFGTNPLRSIPTLDPDFRTEVGMIRTEVGEDRSGHGPKWARTEVDMTFREMVNVEWNERLEA